MPYESKSQMRKFFAMEAKNEIPKGTAKRWAHHTPDIKALPEHVKKSLAEPNSIITVSPTMARAMGGGVLGGLGGGLYGAINPEDKKHRLRSILRSGLMGAAGGAGLGAGSGIARNFVPDRGVLSGLGVAGGGLAGALGGRALMDKALNEPKPRESGNMSSDHKAEKKGFITVKIPSALTPELLSWQIGRMADNMPLAKQASARQCQTLLAQGKTVVEAVKTAFALDDVKATNFVIKTAGMAMENIKTAAEHDMPVSLRGIKREEDPVRTEHKMTGGRMPPLGHGMSDCK